MTTKELHGIHHELLFWSGFVKTKRFIDGWVGKQKTPELNNFVAEFILNKPHDKVLSQSRPLIHLGIFPDSFLTTKPTKLTPLCPIRLKSCRSMANLISSIAQTQLTIPKTLFLPTISYAGP